VAIAIILIAASLIFFRLDRRLLWIDEAETALLARNILVYGVPKAYDGKTLISQEVGREYGPNYLWHWTPWLEKYVAAMSFGLLGESTFSARLPFAIVGLLSVISMYPLAMILFRDRWVAILSMAFLTLTVPFLLHVRQCRYYSLVIVATIWAVYFFVGLTKETRGAVTGFAAAMTVLFHSNILAFFGTGIALVPCLFVLDFTRTALRRLVLAGAIVLVVNGPWAYFFLAGKSETPIQSFSENLMFYLEVTNRYTLPFAAVLIFLGLRWYLGPKRLRIHPEAWRCFSGLIAFVALYLVIVSPAPWSFYRYTVGLLPISSVLLAFMSWNILKWNRSVGAAFTVSLLLTGLFHQLSASAFTPPKFTVQTHGGSFPICDRFLPIGNYLYELAQPLDGPMESLVKYLSRNGQRGDRVFISYGDLVLKFYTDYEVRGGQTGQSLQGWAEPEWIIVRGFFRFYDRPALRPDAENMRGWLRSITASDYIEIRPPWTDVPWDNIPEPQFHWFRPPEDGPKMKIYRRETEKH